MKPDNSDSIEADKYGLVKLSDQNKGVCLERIPDVAGVYKLYQVFEGGVSKCIYIGQSKNIRERIKTHKSEKKFNSVGFTVIQNKKLRDKVEKILIAANKPTLNNNGSKTVVDRGSYFKETEFIDRNIDEIEDIPEIEDEKITPTRELVFSKIRELSKGDKEGIEQSKVIKKCKKDGYIQNKETGYYHINNLLEDNRIEVTNPEKERYRKVRVKK